MDERIPLEELMSMQLRTMVRSWAAAAAVMTATVITGCGDEDNTGPGGETELVTRVTMTLTPVGGGTSQSAAIEDPDGNGPQPPGAPSLTFTLEPGVTYNGTITLENASNPANVLDLTDEVETEKNAHRFFYTVTGLNGVTIPDASLDLDDNGAPFGLNFQVVVSGSAASGQSGTIRVTLSHYDDEPKGDGSEPSNETDVDVTFNAATP